jgi:hypothetical protein
MIMKKLLLIAVTAGALLMLGNTASAIGAIDVIQSPTGFFTPNDAVKLSAPYYRWWNEDWGWTHSGTPFAGVATINSATLNISAFDVDWPSGQVDNIYAYDNGVKTLLGTLTGQNQTWSYATFVLGPEFYDDILAGLQVWMDIDSTHNYDTWAISLAKSVVEVNGNPIPDPDPTVPDGGATAALLGLVMVGLGCFRRVVK